MQLEKNTLLLSVGPYQFLSQYILAKQKGLENNIAGVIRTDSPAEGKNPNQLIIDCEKWICEILNVNFVSKIKSIYKLWGKNKLSKLIGLFFIKKRIRTELNKNNTINFDNIENVFLTYRKDLGEILILSSLKNLKNVYFISDGSVSVLSSQKPFKLPFYLKIFGVKNCYKNNPDVYFFKEAIPKQYFNIKPKELNQNIRLETINLITTNNIYKKWKINLFKGIETRNNSMIFLQPLENYPDLKTNILLYTEIIKKELKKSDNLIIIKYHPREQKQILEIFKKSILNQYSGKVVFYDNHFLSSLPIELYFKDLKINRVITLFSAAVYVAKDYANIIIYSSNILPEKYQNMIKETAMFLNTKIDYIYIEDNQETSNIEINNC